MKFTCLILVDNFGGFFDTQRFQWHCTRYLEFFFRQLTNQRTLPIMIVLISSICLARSFPQIHYDLAVERSFKNCQKLDESGVKDKPVKFGEFKNHKIFG